MSTLITTASKASGLRSRRYRLLAEINVTPFVDVMLVLLIVFMVTAPLLSTGIPVDLPRAHARNIVQDTHPIIVTVRTDEQIFVHENPVQLGDLVPMLDKMTQGDTATRIFIRGDRRLIYERITQVMGELHAAGFSHVALVVDQLPNGSLKKEH